MALRPQVKTLEDAGLLLSSIDEKDQRRKTIEVSSKGYLVKYHRIKITSKNSSGLPGKT